MDGIEDTSVLEIDGESRGGASPSACTDLAQLMC